MSKLNRFNVIKGTYKVTTTLYSPYDAAKYEKAFVEARHQAESFNGWDRYKKNRVAYIAESEAKDAAFNMHMIRIGRFAQLENDIFDEG